MFADALQLILICVLFLHFLNFILCAPTFHETQRKINDVQALFNKVGVPIALDKLEGPSQVMTYSGFKLIQYLQWFVCPKVTFLNLRT